MPPARKRPAGALGGARGGVRQRLAAAAAERDAASEPSHLALLLKQLWAWGDLSAPAIQKIAAAAEKDGATSPEIKALASMGGSGAYPGNAHRDLVQRLPRAALADVLSHVRVGEECRPKFTC